MLELGDLEFDLGGGIESFSLLDRALKGLNGQAHFLQPDSRNWDSTLGANELIEIRQADIDKRGRANWATTTTLNDCFRIHERNCTIFLSFVNYFVIFFQKKEGEQKILCPPPPVNFN